MPSFEIVNINDTITPFFNFIILENKLLFLVIIAFILIIIGFIFKKEYKNNCDSTETKYIIHEDEICADCVYYTYPVNKVKYILWTGGYDSTFLLCWYFIVKNEPVQPIYIMCGNVDSNFNTIGRNNQKYEIRTMKKIRQILIEKYKYKKSRLLPTYYVYSIKKNNIITSKFIKLHRKYGFFSRDISQYERIARLSDTWTQPLYIGLEKCRTGLDKATYTERINEGTDECMIKRLEELKVKELDIFNNIRFSIVHLTKLDMKNISIDSNSYFYDILQLTISCWYPNTNGSGCGKCPMCNARII